MAVTVEQVPYLVLDGDYRIVEVGSGAEASFEPLLGQNVWECFPGSRPLYQPYYERARRTGAPVEFAQYYNGRVMRLRAVSRGDRLLVHYEILSLLDVLTLDGLRASLDTALTRLAEADDVLRRERLRSSLRVVGGRV